MNKKLNILLAAGGTGGHIFPAEALAQTLSDQGHNVFFATDVRGMRFVNNFPAKDIVVIEGATVFSKSPMAVIKSVFKIFKGIVQSLIYVQKNKVNVVVGFGGYPSFAPLFAGKLLFKPSVLHEQNAVLGRANKFLAKLSQKVALSFKHTKFTEGLEYKTKFIGNPLRAVVRDMNIADYVPYQEDEKFKLVVFGGSQGAKIFNEVLPAAIKLLPETTKHKLLLTQQVSDEDLELVKKAYKDMGVDATLAPFFNDMPELIKNCHVVIGRAGATTVAELCYIGRPSLLVPLPGALDADQANNAKNIDSANAGWLCVQKEFSAEYLSGKISKWINIPETLELAAMNAKRLGQPNAAEQLAELVVATARK